MVEVYPGKEWSLDTTPELREAAIALMVDCPCHWDVVEVGGARGCLQVSVSWGDYTHKSLVGVGAALDASTRARIIAEIDRALERAARQKETSVRGLYEVFIVEPDTGKVSGPYHGLANCETTAKLKALRLVDMPSDLDDYDIIVRRLGDVRPKREPTEVRITK